MPSSQLTKEVSLPTSGFTLDYVPPISPTAANQTSKFFMVGGLTANSEVFPYVVKYNPKHRELQYVQTLGPFPQGTERFNEISSPLRQEFSPSRRHLHSSCMLHRRLFVFGGYALPADTSAKEQDDLMCDPQKIYSLDVDTQQWQQVEVISSTRYYVPSRTESVGTTMTEPGLSHTLDDGISSESDEEPREVADINGTASHAQTGPLARIGHTCVSHPSNPKSVMVLFGGYTSSGQYSNELCTFQVAPGQERGSWATLAAPIRVPVGRCGHSANIYGNSMVVFGGFDGRRCLNDLWRYDFSAKSWRPLAEGPDGPSPRFGHTAVLFEDQLFILGGRDSEGRDLNDLWSYNLIHFKWKQLTSRALTTPGGVFGAKAIALNGKAFVFGGVERKKSSFTIRVLDLLHVDRPSHDTIVNSLVINPQIIVPPKSRARSRQASQTSSPEAQSPSPNASKSPPNDRIVVPPKAKSRAKKRLEELKDSSHDTRLTFTFENTDNFAPIAGVFASPEGPIVSPKTPPATTRNKNPTAIPLSIPPKASKRSTAPKPPTETPGNQGNPNLINQPKKPSCHQRNQNQKKKEAAPPSDAQKQEPPPTNSKEEPSPIKSHDLPPPAPKSKTRLHVQKPHVPEPTSNAVPDDVLTQAQKEPPSPPKPVSELKIDTQSKGIVDDVIPETDNSKPQPGGSLDDEIIEGFSFGGLTSPQKVPYAPLAKSGDGDLNQICQMAEQLPNLILNDLTCAYEGYEKSLGDIAYLKARLAIVATHQPGKLESLHDARIKSLEDQLLEATQEIWRLKQDRNTYRQLISSSNAKLNGLETEFQTYSQSQIQAMALKKEMEMQAEITKLNVENKELANNVEHLQTKAHAHSLETFTLKAQLKVSESRQNTLEKALEHANASEQVALERAGIAEKLVDQITRQDMDGEEQANQDQHFKTLWQAARKQINLARKLSNPLAVASEEVMAELDQTHMAFQNATNTIHELADQVETLSAQLGTHATNKAAKHDTDIFTSYVKLVEQQQEIYEKIGNLHTQALQQKSHSHTLEQALAVSDARWLQVLKVNQEVSRRNKAVLGTISNLTNGQFTSVGMSSLEVPIAASTLSSKLSEDEVLSKLQISLATDEPSIGSLGSAADIKNRLAMLRSANLQMSQGFLNPPMPKSSPHNPQGSNKSDPNDDLALSASPERDDKNPNPLPTAVFPSLQALAELDSHLGKHQHQYSPLLGQKQ
ncbi:hypothetical protein DSO57_1019080 [Entomophthora muscae]|uniref:Uncharacterized protein n=1 Tax=Entomophthora muscae TaxID=34485 RepID=A0ACC2STS1_9FUNG|nr:hypothetical protein DSO57_1019080 [Entomophthora muscae]